MNTETDLLDFARGPALEAALIILVFGMFWRLVGVLALRRSRDLSEPRVRHAWLGGIRTIFTRMWPRREFRPRILHWEAVSYLFHFALAVVILGLVPHILLIRDITGLSWPGLPTGVITFAAGVALISLLALLAHRATHPVLRRISNFDDYFSWLLVFAPLLTGLMAYYHLGGPYEDLLAVHMLSAELLLAWLPFSKLAHTVLFLFSRGVTGTIYSRRGAQT